MNTTEQDALKLLERNRVGALLRVFAHTPQAVEPQVESAIRALRRLLSLRTGNRPSLARIDFLVSSDPDFADADCGLTAGRLREEIQKGFSESPVNVFEIKKGDIYCMLLNYGVANQLEDRIPYSIILSHHVASYATQENINGLLAAMQHRARVAGVAILELNDLIRRGAIADTFAIWHNKSLMTIGGFDLRAAKPLTSRAHMHEMVLGWSEVKATRHGDGTVKFHVAGVEEIIPLVRLTRFFGRCIAVIEPTGEGMEWKEFDEDKDKEGYHRHLAKMGTKEARQRRMAKMEGVDLEFLAGGLMDGSVEGSQDIF